VVSARGRIGGLSAERDGLFHEPKNGYSIRVIFEKGTGRWQTEKFKGKRLNRTACGPTFAGASASTSPTTPSTCECER
jgi:hypothetical protein